MWRARAALFAPATMPWAGWSRTAASGRRKWPWTSVPPLTSSTSRARRTRAENATGCERGVSTIPLTPIKCISPQVRSVYNPAGDVVSRPRLLLRDREVVNRNRTRQIFEICSWSAAVTPAIADREASAMAPSCAIFIKIYAWAMGHNCLPRSTRPRALQPRRRRSVHARSRHR